MGLTIKKLGCSKFLGTRAQSNKESHASAGVESAGAGQVTLGFKAVLVLGPSPNHHPRKHLNKN